MFLVVVLKRNFCVYLALLRLLDRDTLGAGSDANDVAAAAGKGYVEVVCLNKLAEHEAALHIHDGHSVACGAEHDD